MKTLLVVRHGKSDWAGDEPDRERPLGRRGRRQSPESGTWIAAHHPDIDLAVVSPALRARETWDLVAAELPAAPEVVLDERVYAAWGADLVDVIRELPESAATVALVGHNPALEDVVVTLSGEGVAMPTSAVAVIQWPGTWSAAGKVEGRLVAHGRPPA